MNTFTAKAKTSQTNEACKLCN